MIHASADKSRHAYARVAGFMYLFGIASYLVGHALVSRSIAPGDFAASAPHVMGDEQTYRIGLALMLATSWGTILLAGALYILLKPVNASLALLALLWRVVETGLGAVAHVARLSALQNFIGSTGGASNDVRAMLNGLETSGANAAVDAASLFFSAGSLVFFYLFFKSRDLPRALSVLGIIASLLVALMGLADIILAHPPPELDYGWAPMFLAEIGAGLWLLIAGARRTDTGAAT